MSDEITAADLGSDDVSEEAMEDVGEVDEVVEAAPDEGGDAPPAEHVEPVPDPAKAVKPKAEEKPPAPARTYKIKVNGKEQEVPADAIEGAAKALGVEPDALLGGTRMFRAANEKFQQAAQLAQQAKALEARLQSDPASALREMLGDEKFTAIAVGAVQELMQVEQMTPEQRRIRELEAAQQKVEQERQTAKQRAQAEQAQRFQAEVTQRLDKEITEALTSGKLPKDPYVVKRLAAAMEAHLARGVSPDDLSISDLVPLVQEEMAREHESFLGTLSGEDVIQRFPSLAEKVRKAYAARVAGRRAVPDLASKPRPKAAPAQSYGSIGAVLRDW